VTDPDLFRLEDGMEGGEGAGGGEGGRGEGGRGWGGSFTTFNTPPLLDFIFQRPSANAPVIFLDGIPGIPKCSCNAKKCG
jgi:hypothetical protein